FHDDGTVRTFRRLPNRFGRVLCDSHNALGTFVAVEFCKVGVRNEQQHVENMSGRHEKLRSKEEGGTITNREEACQDLCSLAARDASAACDMRHADHLKTRRPSSASTLTS